MNILVNNVVHELSIIDPPSGMDWTHDLIGNVDGYDGYDEDQEMHIMTHATYKWWDDYIAREQDLADRIDVLRHDLPEDVWNACEIALQEAGDHDLECMQGAQISVVESWETS
jgi:hypothetical protein